MSYRVARKDNAASSGQLNKEEMQQAKYGTLRRAMSGDMTHLDRRDHYHSLFYNKMVCAPGFEIDRKSGGLSYKVGDYYLSSLLGKGGGGSVYEGRHRKTNRRVAIKVVTKSRSQQQEGLALAEQALHMGGSQDKDLSASVAYAKKIQRTRKEYTVMSHLRDHRHITRLIEVVENDKAICLVMELGAGGDLFQLIQAKGRLSLHEAWFYFRQVVSAVAHAHAQGFVHRDIKPENVFLSEDRKTATLGDWGFADVWCSFKDLKEGVGSLNYCSPEIVCGRAYTGPEVDLWSLGTLLYAMVTGNLPFAADSPKQVVHNIRTANFALSGSSCELDPLLYDLLSKLLHPNPLLRAKMADVLQHRWFRNGPTLAHLMRKDRRKRTGSATNLPTSAAVAATPKNRHRTRVN